ncbi:MAG: AMP-binding protein, partial [Tepidisphaeraceae bacterium]
MRDHLATLLDDFRLYGSDIAVVHHHGNRRQRTTYTQLARLASRFAAWLDQQSIQPGDRLLLWAHNSAEWIAAFYGCLLRGVLVVPLDVSGSPDFAARILAEVSPTLIVGDELLLNQLGQIPIPTLKLEDFPAILPERELGPIDGLNHDTPLQILFTSGTTGDPKGIVLTHGNVLASVAPIEAGARPYLRYARLIHPLRILHTLPLSHVFGQTMGLWIPPILRAEVHFESRLVAPRLIHTIRRERISVLAAVPRIHALLQSNLEAAHPALADQLAAATGIRAWQRWLRFRRIHATFGFKFWALISGGGALPAPVENFWSRLGFVVIQGYGMTETTALITLNHPFRVSTGSIGKPLPGREVKLGPDGEVLVRGPMISTSTWTGGGLQSRADEWLSTGDLAVQDATGDLRFLGRKSEVIVTSAGLNIHPEDIEAVLDRQPGVVASAVVSMATPSGPEPCVVLALRGDAPCARIIDQANAELAAFQRISRWVLWPDPDLPRTSTGKVRRRVVAAWVASQREAAAPSQAAAQSPDWLLALIQQITGEAPSGVVDELRLGEDLHLDSLGRVQLAAALEERLGLSATASIEDLQTLGQLRDLLARPDGQTEPADQALNAPSLLCHPERSEAESKDLRLVSEQSASNEPEAIHIYPRWPWSKPVLWLRIAFIEAVLRPLVGLLAAPRVDAQPFEPTTQPLLIVANHVTALDGPLLQYALPTALRRHLAVAMAADMLHDYRHFRNPEPPKGRFMPLGPLVWLLLTALFNVFPLPRRRGFEASFAHAGLALDRGFHVLLFPEGTRSLTGQLAAFRPGIGLLVKQSGAQVLPMA